MILFFAFFMSGCVSDNILIINDNGHRIKRIIFSNTTDTSALGEQVNISDLTGNSSNPSYLFAFKNGNAYDLGIVPCPLNNMGSSTGAWDIGTSLGFGNDVNEVIFSFDGAYAISLDSSRIFSGVSAYNPAGGETYYYTCGTQDCPNHGNVYTGDVCPDCGNVGDNNADGYFVEDGTYSTMFIDWVDGQGGPYGTKQYKKLQFDELIIKGFDFSTYLKSVKYRHDYSKYEGALDNIDWQDYSYMFSDLPCKKITIMDASNLQNIDLKFQNRDEYMTYVINNELISYNSKYASYRGETHTIDEFLEIYRTVNSATINKNQLLVLGTANRVFDCPITYSDYTQYLSNKTFDEYVSAVNANPASFSLSTGHTYTNTEIKAELDKKFIAISRYTQVSPLIDDSELENYYANAERFKINLSHMFANCPNLEEVDFGNLFDNVDVVDTSYMFYDCPKLKTIDLSTLDTSSVTDMSYMFYNCKSLKNIDVTSLDTSNVTDMSHMFDMEGKKPFTNRDDDLLNQLNNSCAIRAYLPEIKSYFPFESLDGFVTIYNETYDTTETKLSLIYTGLTNHLVTCPVTYDEYAQTQGYATFEAFYQHYCTECEQGSITPLSSAKLKNKVKTELKSAGISVYNSLDEYYVLTFANRDEELLYLVNNYVVDAYLDGLSSNLPFTSVDSFIEAYNEANNTTETKLSLIALGITNNIISCPVTYDEYAQTQGYATFEAFYQHYCTECEQGSVIPVSQDEYKNDVEYGANNLGIIICDSLEDYYGEEEEVALESLTLGGETSLFTIKSGTKVQSLFGSAKSFKKIVLPDIDTGVSLSLPGDYVDADGNKITTIDSSSSGETLTAVSGQTENPPIDNPTTTETDTNVDKNKALTYTVIVLVVLVLVMFKITFIPRHKRRR